MVDDNILFCKEVRKSDNITIHLDIFDNISERHFERHLVLRQEIKAVVLSCCVCVLLHSDGGCTSCGWRESARPNGQGPIEE